MSNEARVTVCIPTYNRAHFLRQTLSSLCDQGLNRNEYVVAISDNCSNDQTPDVVTEYRDRLQIIYHRNTENIGMRKNLDFVMGLCETPYIVCLPDDDLLAPGQLGRALSAFDAHEGAVLVSSLAVVQGYPGDPKSLMHGMFLRANAQTSYSYPYVFDKTEWLALSLLSTPLSLIGAVFQHAAFRRCELWKPYQFWADRLLLAEMGLYGDVLSLPWVGGYYRIGKHSTNFQHMGQYDYEFKQVTRDILDVCKKEKIPVVEFWGEQIRLSTLSQRARYLPLLKDSLPSSVYNDIRRDSKTNFKTDLAINLVSSRSLERWGVKKRAARLLRAIGRYPG